MTDNVGDKGGVVVKVFHWTFTKTLLPPTLHNKHTHPSVTILLETELFIYFVTTTAPIIFQYGTLLSLNMPF